MKEVKKSTKKPTKKVTKKNTVKKNNRKKNKKGFTLIELLAVIIILGVLMIIAIPSVTSYISNSRKSSYIDTAKNIVGAARNLVNSGKLEMYDVGTTYYIPTKCIKTENASESPYGAFDKSYVLVTYNGEGYNYYWVSVDETGQGVPNPIAVNNLDIDDIQNNIKADNIKTNVTKDGTEKVLVLDEGTCSEFYNGMPRADEFIRENAIEDGELFDLGDNIYIYTGKNPKNYVIFNNETWRIIGIYGNQLKLVRNSSIGRMQYNSSGSNRWKNSSLEKYLNSEDEGGYIYGLSSEAQNMLGEGTWYTNPLYYRSSAVEAWNGAKNGTTLTRKVGLIASYEYLYAANSSCHNTSGYDFEDGCGDTDWMLLTHFWWFINPANDSSYSVLFVWRGAITRTGNSWADSKLEVLPAVYLKSSVTISGGTGTAADPFKLSLE